jgi:23S rRNA pseudouridine1911/1915/1917 synthase
MDQKNNSLNKLTGGKQNGAGFIVTDKDLLMDFLVKQLPHKSRNNIKSLLTHKQVFVDGKQVSQYNHPLAPGQKVEIGSSRVEPEQKFREYTIVYEDQHLIVIDKAAGLLSMATESEKRITAYSLLSRHVKSRTGQTRFLLCTGSIGKPQG